MPSVHTETNGLEKSKLILKSKLISSYGHDRCFLCKQEYKFRVKRLFFFCVLGEFCDSTKI